MRACSHREDLTIMTTRIDRRKKTNFYILPCWPAFYGCLNSKAIGTLKRHLRICFIRRGRYSTAVNLLIIDGGCVRRVGPCFWFRIRVVKANIWELWRWRQYRLFVSGFYPCLLIIQPLGWSIWLSLHILQALSALEIGLGKLLDKSWATLSRWECHFNTLNVRLEINIAVFFFGRIWLRSLQSRTNVKEAKINLLEMVKSVKHSSPSERSLQYASCRMWARRCIPWSTNCRMGVEVCSFLSRWPSVTSNPWAQSLKQLRMTDSLCDRISSSHRCNVLVPLSHIVL